MSIIDEETDLVEDRLNPLFNPHNESIYGIPESKMYAILRHIYAAVLQEVAYRPDDQLAMAQQAVEVSAEHGKVVMHILKDVYGEIEFARMLGEAVGG